jgi:hypothetical protein
MNEEQKIKFDHIRKAGEKIQSSVMFIVAQILFSIIAVVFLFNVKPDSLVEIGSLISLISSVLLIMSLVNLNSAGFNLIAAVTFTQKPAKSLDEFDPTTEGNYFETECYPNGKIKVKKSFSKEGVKHGVWEYYLENGDLDYKEFYQNGSWVQNIR